MTPVAPTSQPALRRALRLVGERDPALAARASSTLDTLLGGVARSPRPDAWRFSSLTRTGFPVEFAFSSHDPALRYTVEVLGPEGGRPERLREAEQLLRRFGAPPDGPQGSQQPDGEGWGAWLGVRHRPGGERYKLYVEAHAAAAALAAGLVGPEPLLPSGAERLVAVGREPGAPLVELYYLIDRLGLDYWEIGYLLRRCGLAARQPDLVELLEELRGYTLGQRRPPLPLATYGFSLAVEPGGSTRVFSLFTFPGSLLGGDGATRRAVLEAATRRGWDMSLYEALSAPLAAHERRDRHHSAVGFLVAAEGPAALHIALSPPGEAP